MNNLPQWSLEPQNISPSHPIYPWLIKPYIISKAMKICCKTLEVALLQHKKMPAFEDEKQLLELTHEWPLIRKVYLKGDGIPWSFGRVVVPTPTYLAFQTSFDTLGGQLIGESLLYGHPQTTRGPFDYAQLTPDHDFYQDMLHLLDQHYPLSTQPSLFSELWGRRSIFHINGHPLLVSEAYFPWIPTYPSAL